MRAKKGDILKTCLEPENAIDKFAVAVEKERQIVGHISIGKSGRFAKTTSYLILANQRNACEVEVCEKSQLRRRRRSASTMYSSVFRKRRVFRNIYRVS